jgi:hypothetical protein
VTSQAERTEVGEVALAAAFDDRDDVVGFPEGAAGVGGEVPIVKQAQAGGAAGTLQDALRDERVDAAAFADAAVAFEDLVTEIAGV